MQSNIDLDAFEQVQRAISENHQMIAECGDNLKRGHLAKLPEAKLEDLKRQFVDAVKKANQLQNKSEQLLRDAGLKI